MDEKEPRLTLRQFMTLEPKRLVKIELEISEWECLLSVMNIGLISMRTMNATKPEAEADEDLGHIVYVEEIVEEVRSQLKKKEGEDGFNNKR